MKMILVEYHFCSYKHLSCVILFVGLWWTVFLCDGLQGPKTQDHKHGCADNACHLNSLCLLSEYCVWWFFQFFFFSCKDKILLASAFAVDISYIFPIYSWTVLCSSLVHHIHIFPWYRTGTSLQWRLMQENIMKKRITSFAFEKTPRISLRCNLAPVQYRKMNMAY